ncbi:DUF3152 domain-containing protein [Actinoplanes sp. NPDC023936]|uniref:DUF3152 domain-containing protein n=1 Tax=Actinoplanes sp. NPDC023936 TaxID=3154910 RepID=UPI0033DD4507
MPTPSLESTPASLTPASAAMPGAADSAVEARPDAQPEQATNWGHETQAVEEHYEHSRPARGLPASLRLPAELPANLYIPPTREETATREETGTLAETPTLQETATGAETATRAEASVWEGTPIWGEAPTHNHPDAETLPEAATRQATPTHVEPQQHDTPETHSTAPAHSIAPDDAWAYPPETHDSTPEDTTAERLYLSDPDQPHPGHRPATDTDDYDRHPHHDDHDDGFLPAAFARDANRTAANRTAANQTAANQTAANRTADGEPADYDPDPDATARYGAPDAGTRRTIRRRRRTVLLAYLMVVAGVLIVGHELRSQDKPLPPEPAGLGEGAGVQTPAPAPTQGIVPNDVRAQAPVEEEAAGQGAGEFRYAKSRGPMLGTGGKLHRFRVAVEKTVDGTAPAAFAEMIDRTLGDERSWVNDGRLRLRRVPSAGNADFTIYLASAGTSEKMCATGGLHTDGFTSCRVPGQVIINVDRWTDAIPEYAEHVDEYRRYAINHEVGHELGHGHEACPGEGEKAPVMMPQTYGLKGCTRNAWPYLDGKRYSGEPAA